MEKLDRVYVVYSRTKTKDGFAIYEPKNATRDYEFAEKTRATWQKLQDKGFFSQYLYSTYVIKTQNDVELVQDGAFVKINGFKNKVELVDGEEKEEFVNNTAEFLTEYTSSKNSITGREM